MAIAHIIGAGIGFFPGSAAFIVTRGFGSGPDLPDEPGTGEGDSGAMAETKFDICSRALRRIGCKAITSFDDLTAESIVAGQEYEALLEAKLCGPPRWRFATTQFDLNLVAASPLARWSYVWQIPADCLMVHAVTRGSVPIEFDHQGDKIYANYNEGLTLEYAKRVDESFFPAYFREALVTELSAHFALAIKRNQAMQDSRMKRAEEIVWPRARILDRSQQTNRPLRASRLTGNR